RIQKLLRQKPRVEVSPCAAPQAQGEPQPLAFDEDGLLNPLTQQRGPDVASISLTVGARANEEENTHSCLQIGGTIFSSVMVQEACLKACGSGAVIHEPWKGKYAITADNTKAASPQRAGNNHLVLHKSESVIHSSNNSSTSEIDNLTETYVDDVERRKYHGSVKAPPTPYLPPNRHYHRTNEEAVINRLATSFTERTYS
ncbi:hypothetical protein Tco_0912806, partial [Tanacetum coccineum]